MIFLKPHSTPIFFTLCLSTFIIISSPIMSFPETESPYTGTTSAFVTYTNAGDNADLNKSPRINLGFNGSGKYVPFIMDTGSVGIIASPDIFTPARGAKFLGKGQQIYSSSGIIEEGYWWSATQEIYDPDGNLIATANVPVLQVTAVKCVDNARDCQVNNNPTNIAVMGIGFARESPEQTRGTPNYNAFLNLKTIVQNNIQMKLPKDWCNGYVVCPTGVFLGLTSTNTADAGFVKLLPWTQYSTPTLLEWMPAPTTLKVNGVRGDGHILMDTGVTTGFLTPPSGANVGPLVECPGSTLVECLADGNVIDVYLPDEDSPVAHYTITIGDNSNPMQPDGVHKVPSSKIFFNTSRHVLGGINFIYDNTNGYIGYVWNGHSPDSVGFVHPAIVSSTTTVSSSLNPAYPSDNVTFTATVVGVNCPQIPTGGVTFIIDNDLSAQQYIPLDGNGQATLSTSTLSRGSHVIVAKYSGDLTYIRSNSPNFIQKIK